ncbi:cellulose synthase operon protein YhjQ [Paenalcaligenes hominis]|uniref:Cellulose synthase operon protein YhjQ n=1 Tax=Paenalcaligenes hominis TaxID=643674 RepID=A0A1U9JX73_9BURK|nr:cellulose biosynthesis protein BcsQ [Paenalcaligenes hominis]AQS50403.1 cellulose synthase operon protein YhjQ [Paenalcaligenes hominis]
MKRSIIALSGLRGGAGTTSVAAMLADSLRRLDQSVLVIDFNEADLLRLHFNIPYEEQHGWAAVVNDPYVWMDQTYQVAPSLWVLPYGRHALSTARPSTEAIQSWINALPQQLVTTAELPQWILLDLPVLQTGFNLLYEASALHLLIVEPDMAAHILLGQYVMQTQTHIVVNRHNPACSATEAVLMDWQQRYRSRLAPLNLHLDAHVNEALGHKMPATTYFPESSAAQDMQSLATWCLTHCR